MSFPRTWVVVADSARARVFELTAVNGPLEELFDLTHPESRLQEQALTSDRPGMSFNSGGRNSQHPMQSSHSAQDNAANAFAHEIAHALKSGFDGEKYHRLVLIAPPAFLGQLRKQLNEQVSKTVVASLDLHLTKEPPAAILKRLPTPLGHPGAAH